MNVDGLLEELGMTVNKTGPSRNICPHPTTTPSTHIPLIASTIRTSTTSFVTPSAPPNAALWNCDCVMGNLGELSPGGSVAVGILVGLVSTSVQSLGLTLQRKSHILEDEKAPHDVRRPPHRRRRWQLGMAMFIISNLVGSTIQITTLPLPVLSTLQASGLVFNSICATLILGEPFTRWSLGGTALVSVGALLIAIFGAIPEPAHTLNQLLELMGRNAFVLWMIFQAILVMGIIVAVWFLSRIPGISTSPRGRLGKGLAYGSVSGILSAHSLLVAKSAVELLVRTIVDRNNQFNRWQSWVILIGLVTVALTQLYFLHKGLKLVSTSVLYPLVFCIYNIIAILDGLIYFDQTDRLTPLHAGLIALGTIILLSGVLALSWRLSDEQTQNPAVAQSALAPGLGFVEDTDNEEYSDDLVDEEAAFQSENQALISGEPMTPTTKLDTVLGATRHVRKIVRLTEADEIWGELQDDATKSTSPSRQRRSSTNLSSLPYPKSPLRQGDSQADVEANESTSLLRNNSFNRRRRRSTGFKGFMARPRSRSLKKKSTIPPQQEATGGFWKMKWWRRRDGSGKGPPKMPDPGEGPSSGGSGGGANYGAAGSSV